MFVIDKQRLFAVLGDFGKAVKAPWHTSKLIGPRALQAPETDSVGRYTFAADVYTFGLDVIETLLPDFVYWPGFERDAPQTPAFMNMLYQKLADAAKTSTLAAHVSGLLRRMLDLNPTRRPTFQQVLAAWPAIAATDAEATVPTLPVVVPTAPITALVAGLPSAKKARIPLGELQTGMFSLDLYSMPLFFLLKRSIHVVNAASPDRKANRQFK